MKRVTMIVAVILIASSAADAGCGKFFGRIFRGRGSAQPQATFGGFATSCGSCLQPTAFSQQPVTYYVTRPAQAMPTYLPTYQAPRVYASPQSPAPALPVVPTKPQPEPAEVVPPIPAPAEPPSTLPFSQTRP